MQYIPSAKRLSTTSSPPTRVPLTQPQIDAAMSTCLSLQTTAVTQHGKRPFAALLLAPDNTTVLLTHYSISHIRHAEAELVRLASEHFSQEYLWACTLVSTWEPCAMCAGTLYWGNVGRLVYAASEEELGKLTGGGNQENMTMSLPCRTVLEAGQKDVEVNGPLGREQGNWEEKVVEESGKWWKEHNRVQGEAGKGKNGESVNGNGHHGNGYVESVYSTQNDDGEYEAQLDIDWLR